MTLNQSGSLFLPRAWHRNDVLRWLKRTHAWTGFWGALLFLLLGTSGFLLNHRTLLKIETSDPVEVSSMEIAVRPGQFADADALGKWAKREFDMPTEPREPRELRKDGSPGGRNANKPAARVFMGKPHVEAVKWSRNFVLVDGRVTVDYVPGAPSVTVRREGQGLLSTIKNLHKGTGLGIAWVLFLDTIAGALVAMSLTGLLLWTRLHGSRLVAGGLMAASLAWATFAVVPMLDVSGL